MQERCGALDWLIHVQSSSTERLTDVAIRPDGTLALTGYFARALTLGVGRPDAVVVPEGCVTSAWEGLVATYAPDGTPLWHRVQQSCGDVWTQVVATGSDGSVYASGYFLSSATFGAGTPGEIEFLGEGFFFVKYAADGTLLWARQALLADDINARGGVYDATVGPNGELFVTGDFGDDVTLTFDPGGPQEVVFAEPFAPWIASYAADGTLLWVRVMGGRANYSEGIAVTTSGLAWTPKENVEITLGVGEPNEITMLSSPGISAVLASYDPANGTLQWGSMQGGNEARDLAPTGLGDILMAGPTAGISHFGVGQPTATDLPANSFYLARYADAGGLQWATSAVDGGSTGRHAAAGAGLAAVTGMITTQDTLLAPCGPTLHNDGINDYSGFAASYDLTTGVFRCAWGFGGPDLDDPAAGAVGLDGAVYVVGEFQGRTTFAAGTPQEQTLVATGSDSFLVRFGPPTAP